MQTFLPYSDFSVSVYCLDNRRLGKQRVEAYQILRTLCGLTQGWQNHPAVKMWRGYEAALTVYMNFSIQEWRSRGFNNSMIICPIHGTVECPPWLGNSKFHDSHKSNLLRKDPFFYKQYDWNVPHNLDYVWPNV